MDLLIVAVALLFAGTLIQAILTVKRGKLKNLPPGPVPLPVIGSLHKLGEQPHKSLAQLAKTYGPIMSLKLGRITTNVISSAAAAQEVLQQQDLAFSGRFVPDSLHGQNHYKFSVVFLSVVPRWRTLRKIFNSHIFSGNRLDANVHLRRRKVDELVTNCRESSRTGEAVDIGRAAFRTTLNLLSNAFFSVDLTDPNRDTGQEFKDLVSNIMAEAGKPNLVDYFPILKQVDPQGRRRRMEIYLGKLINLFDGLINDRIERRRKKKKGETNGVLDVLLNASEDHSEIDITQIEHIFLDLFRARWNGPWQSYLRAQSLWQKQKQSSNKSWAEESP